MIVLDSSFLIAYHKARDVHHAAAAGAMRSLVGGAWGRALEFHRRGYRDGGPASRAGIHRDIRPGLQ